MLILGTLSREELKISSANVELKEHDETAKGVPEKGTGAAI